MSHLSSWLYRITETYDILFNIPRVGWCQRGVSKSEAEDIGKHTLTTTILSMFLCLLYKSHCGYINCEKVLIMSLIHDLPEALIGNIAGDVRKIILNFREIELVKLSQILSDVPDNITKILTELFREYRQLNTVEAKLVTLSDKLATLLRALKYYKSGHRDVTDLVKHYSEEVTRLCSEVDCDLVKQEVFKIVNKAIEMIRE